ncbi:MAG: intradiol ring-cleavage dioxygenase [Planctomycetota bacterium]|nr:intradiol ring-cleavage dioxygenase [Planctomycetota bacterium]
MEFIRRLRRAARSSLTLGSVTLVLLAACSVDPVPPRTRVELPAARPDGPSGTSEMPAELSWQDFSPAWNLNGPRLVLTGTVRHSDGTPARDVVLYYYHTNLEGRYVHVPAQARSMPPNELGQTHGAWRGWVRTGADGKYSIHTLRPAPYPQGDEPAHVHVTVLEPGLSEYWIDDFLFADDPLLTPERRVRLEGRGGDGVVELHELDGVLVGERDIVLGLDVPGHRGRQAADGGTQR